MINLHAESIQKMMVIFNHAEKQKHYNYDVYAVR